MSSGATAARFRFLIPGALKQKAVSGSVVLARSVIAALFPSDCRLCGSPLLEISRLPVCTSCLAALRPLAGATCELCGEGMSSSQQHAGIRNCDACQESPPSFAKATAYGAYEGELRGLIHLLKYERVLPAARVLGGMLADAIQKLDLGSHPVLVIPVPLHRSKRREREFNQAELIARSALRRSSLKSSALKTSTLTGSARSNFELAPDLLTRVRPTQSQIGLTRPQRQENMRGAFRVAHLNKVAGRTVLLVDDVLTTGTTASECARVLIKAGAKQVLVATVARTMKQMDVAVPVAAEFVTQAS